ncbi:hypothetical protein A7K91_12065 [Paenibacillus oryzae]|uniref:ABC transporter permease n=1 Tax=Paenibacillus oryzae TaxID=1844972 RepID=A0A1A5YFT4_9BACL|nr:ABC-2 family transporter protein [Paenibacillus oryzae]OBR64260.1 hypothetical protein A7K91_12065 [Paenibacillus oryzae]
MIKHLQLFHCIFTISLQRQLAHRANLFFEILMTAIGLLSGIFAVAAIFSRTSSLAGWSLGGTIVLLGSYQFVSGIIAAFVTPNLAFFQPKVTNGEIDEALLKPASNLFLMSLGTCQPWAITQSLLGLATVGFGIAIGSIKLTALSLLLYGLLLFIGVLTAWASRALLACLAFWAPGMEPSIIYDACWELGRYPLAVYHPFLQKLLTHVIPIAFISTFPALVLVQGPTKALFIGSLIGGSIFLILVSIVWRRALRRYTSATS